MCDISRSSMAVKQLLVGDFWSKVQITSDITWEKVMLNTIELLLNLDIWLWDLGDFGCMVFIKRLKLSNLPRHKVGLSSIRIVLWPASNLDVANSENVPKFYERVPILLVFLLLYHYKLSLSSKLILSRFTSLTRNDRKKQNHPELRKVLSDILAVAGWFWNYTKKEKFYIGQVLSTFSRVVLYFSIKLILF